MKTQKLLAGILAATLLAGAIVAPAMAQPTDTTADNRAVEVERDDDGFDWGLLGLLGLLGLIPRKRHDTVVRQDTPRH